MFKEEYQKEMSEMKMSGEQKTRIVELMTAAPARKTGRAGRTILAAALACAVLVISALALSPGLREQLTAVLGEFEPYAQTVEESVCVKNGVEIRVISAMADGSMVKVYAEARDLEGDRLTAEMLKAEQDGQSTVQGFIVRDNTDPEDEERITGSIIRARCVGFEETTGTALLEFCNWGTFPSDLKEMELTVFSLWPKGILMGETIEGENWEIPLTIETTASRSISLSETVGSTKLKQLELSALGLALFTEGVPPKELTVYLADGSQIQATPDQGLGSRVTYWEFTDPVEIEHVVAVAFGQWYIPLNADGTAGPGSWLSE